LTRGWLLECSCAAPEDVQRHVSKQGLELLELSEIQADLLHRTEELIELIPSLSLLVASLVNEVHFLRADPGYDVSHSEPHWRSRIFVSLPDRLDDVGALRLAESVVHETMHLNLSLFEISQTIVADWQGVMSSPWRNEARPYQGVAHGLFVFACLRKFFEEIRHRKAGRGAYHIQRRIADIRAEITSIDLKELSQGLTTLGKILAGSWHAVGMAPA
jgi:HEXXH motif-containing protein